MIMKNLTLSSVIGCAFMLPSLTHAQIPFGGHDLFIFPVTCSIPSFVPTPCQSTPTPPIFDFHLFAPLYIASAAPLGGFLTMPIGMSLAYPNYSLAPGMWALGALGPPISVGGFFIPSITTPYGCFPPTSLCIPIVTPLGTIEPATGAATGFF